MSIAQRIITHLNSVNVFQLIALVLLPAVLSFCFTFTASSVLFSAAAGSCFFVLNESENYHLTLLLPFALQSFFSMQVSSLLWFLWPLTLLFWFSLAVINHVFLPSFQLKSTDKPTVCYLHSTQSQLLQLVGKELDMTLRRLCKPKWN